MTQSTPTYRSSGQVIPIQTDSTKKLKCRNNKLVLPLRYTKLFQIINRNSKIMHQIENQKLVNLLLDTLHKNYKQMAFCTKKYGQ